VDVFSHLKTPADADSRFYGVASGIVTNNKDPDGMGRVKLKLPWMSDTAETDWARVATPMAGATRGLWLLPEVDDEVLVAFEHGNPETPYVVGSLWNGRDKPPETNGDGHNDVRVLRSRSGHVVKLDDRKGAETIAIVDKSTKNSIVISTKDNTITIKADADITITSGKGKLRLSGNGVEITSQAGVKIEASANMDLKAGPQLNVKGSMVNIN
jgi:phage baseplate assembly protein V